MLKTGAVSEVKLQFFRLRPTLVAICIMAALVLGIVVTFQLWGNVPIPYLTRDVTAVADVPSYIGLLSNLGIVLWSASAALCFFSGVMTKNSDRVNSIFFHCSGGLTMLLLLDDLFLIHENAPSLIGIAEEILYGIYGMLILLYVVTFRHYILQTDYLLLIFAMGLFGFSLAFDFLHIATLLPYDALTYLLEDGAKFVGIAFWLAYFAHTSARVLAAR
jgi:hypothetical protein